MLVLLPPDGDLDHIAPVGPRPGQVRDPMEAVLMALCSCSSVDVVSILAKKRQQLTGLRVTAQAQQAEAPPRIFTSILLTYAVRGQVEAKAVEDAVALSHNKYCSVAKMLEESVFIEYEIVYPEGEPQP